MKEASNRNTVIHRIKQEYRKIHMQMENNNLDVECIDKLRKAIEVLPQTARFQKLQEGNLSKILKDNEFYKLMAILGFDECITFGSRYMYDKDKSLDKHEALKIFTRTALEKNDFYLIAQIHLRLYSAYQYEKLDIKYLEFILTEVEDSKLEKLHLEPDLSAYALGKKSSYPMFRFQSYVQDVCAGEIKFLNETLSATLLEKNFKLLNVLLAHNEVASWSCCFIHEKIYIPIQSCSPVMLTPTRISEEELRSI